MGSSLLRNRLIQHADVGKPSVVVVKIETIADDELGRHGDSTEVNGHCVGSLGGIFEQRAYLDVQGILLLEMRNDFAQRQS